MTPRTLRPVPWLYGCFVPMAVVAVVAALLAYRQFGWTLTSIGGAVFAVVCCGAILELSVSRIVLSGDSMEVRSLWSRRRYAAADIESVTWEAGCGVSVKLKNGGWASLPEMGYNSQGLTNTLRAWLKRSRAAAGEPA